MKHLRNLSAALIFLALASTGFLAWLSPRLHADVMQQIAASGLAEEQTRETESGFFSAAHRGSLRFAASYCPACELMQYHGRSFHALGTLSTSQPALASLDYGLSWPQLPLEPALPELRLNAHRQLFDGFDKPLQAELKLAAGAHSWTQADRALNIQHDGLLGQIQPGQLSLRLPQLAVARPEGAVFELDSLQIRAAAADKLTLTGAAQKLNLPLLDWQAQGLELSYQQQGGLEQLDASMTLRTNSSLLDGSTHDASQGEIDLNRLNLKASLAFARELPRLFSPEVSGAARMLGLFSLYSVHGPAFFASKPAIALSAKAVPVPNGQAEFDIKLRVTEETRRPPMHPMEWRRALAGHVDITAPSQQLAQFWNWASQFISFATGLPGSYADLREQGWVVKLADGRENLAFQLDPLLGPVAKKSLLSEHFSSETTDHNG